MNLAFITVNPNDDYQDLETLSGVTFTADKTYVLQVNGQLLICEAENKPTKGGFYKTNAEPFQWIATGGKLWVKSLQDGVSTINIAD